jgi:hypothetical protein
MGVAPLFTNTEVVGYLVKMQSVFWQVMLIFNRTNNSLNYRVAES